MLEFLLYYFIFVDNCKVGFQAKCFHENKLSYLILPYYFEKSLYLVQNNFYNFACLPKQLLF